LAAESGDPQTDAVPDGREPDYRKSYTSLVPEPPDVTLLMANNTPALLLTPKLLYLFKIKLTIGFIKE